MPMGRADEVIQRIIDAANSAGANQVQLALNRGALPHALFMAQIERFAREVLPRLQAHEVTTVPAAEEAMVQGARERGLSLVDGERPRCHRRPERRRKNDRRSVDCCRKACNIREFVNADEIARGFSPFNPEGSAVRAEG